MSKLNKSAAVIQYNKNLLSSCLVNQKNYTSLRLCPQVTWFSWVEQILTAPLTSGQLMYDTNTVNVEIFAWG